MPEYLTPDIKAVFFDHDDTLVGTIKAKFAQHKHIARTWYDKELNDEEITLHWGKPLTSLLKILYETDDADTAFAHILAVHQDFPKLLLADTIPTLQTLHERGLKLGLVTAASRSSLDHDLESLAIPRDLFSFIQTEEDSDYHKPDPRVFTRALVWLQKQQISPKEVTYVGDGLHDAKAALGAGFNFIGVETGLVTQQQFQGAGHVSVAGLSRLLKMPRQ
jgi:HAD superfamily hydrolase (TIGR01549 family)